MSFLKSAFSGASNDFTPGGGSPQQAKYIATAQNNYGNADNGLLSLANSLAQQAQGGGPNLANAQLQSATAQNVGNQASLMAGQRGASANPALIARQAAMQGANIQQQAAGQSAQNVLAQQLAAQSQLGGVLGTQGSLANQNYGITQGAVTGANQQGAEIGGKNAKANQGLLGGIGDAIGGITGLFAGGGQVPQQQTQPSFIQNFLAAQPQQMSPESQAFNQAIIDQGRNQRLGLKQPNSYAQGGAVPLPFGPMDLRQGGTIQARGPQEQAQIQGNSLKNDKIPGMLSEGEIVIPRSVAQSPNAPTLAAQFVANAKRKK